MSESESRCGGCANEKLNRMQEPCLACVDNDTAKIDSMVRASQFIAKAGPAPEPETEAAVAGGAGAETEVVTEPEASEVADAADETKTDEVDEAEEPTPE